MTNGWDDPAALGVPPLGPLGVSEEDARAMVMSFSEEQPMFVPPRLYADLERRGFLKDPEMARRIRPTPKLPLT